MDSSPPNMHRYIVNGVAEVVGADGGILYLLDNPEQPELVPVFQTEQAAPIIPLPADLFELEGLRQKRRLRSFLQLTTIPPGTGLLGRTLDSGQTVYVEKLLESPAFEGAPNPLQGTWPFAGPAGVRPEGGRRPRGDQGQRAVLFHQ